MAKDTIAKSGIPLNPAGMNDNSPLDAENNWYLANGVHSLNEQCLQRCNGKALIEKLDSPILAIHGDLRERVWVETTTQLLMYDTFIAEEPPPEEDMAIEDYILIQDQKARGVHGGTFFGDGAYYTRELNTEVIDTGNFASIALDSITLQPGIYRFRCIVPAYGVGPHKAVLINDTDGIGYPGSSEFSDNTTPTTSSSIITGRFEILVPTNYYIGHASTVGRNTNGFGNAADINFFYALGDSVEVYTIVEFWRKPTP